MRRPPCPSPAVLRRGFTMLELLIVISIIGILMALILPAVKNALTAAREGQVQAEIRQMEAAISLFKQTYGFEPPSRITLYTTAAGWNGDTTSRTIVRRMYPHAVFDYDTTVSGLTKFPTTWTAGSSYTLTGAECLVFFLGGPLDATGVQPIGFSKNPKYPFAPPAGAGENREGPFFEFKNDRLVVSPNGTNTPFKVYIDSLPGHTAPYHPYIYASSYDGRGYSDGAVATSDLRLDGSTYAMTRVYYSTALTVTTPIPFKPSSCQIISPGTDHEYGTGGYFNPKSQNDSLATAPRELADSSNLNYRGKQEFDNLTNFNSGRLRP